VIGVVQERISVTKSVFPERLRSRESGFPEKHENLPMLRSRSEARAGAGALCDSRAIHHRPRASCSKVRRRRACRSRRTNPRDSGSFLTASSPPRAGARTGLFHARDRLA
jgi:hypothetical protein